MRRKTLYKFLLTYLIYRTIMLVQQDKMDRQMKDNITDLYDALLALKTRDETYNFLKDLLTPQEEHALQERWKVCQLLHCGELSYREIHGITGASLATIGRVARFLKTENYQGYKTILDRMIENEK